MVPIFFVRMELRGPSYTGLKCLKSLPYFITVNRGFWFDKAGLWSVVESTRPRVVTAFEVLLLGRSEAHYCSWCWQRWQASWQKLTQAL